MWGDSAGCPKLKLDPELTLWGGVHFGTHGSPKRATMQTQERITVKAPLPITPLARPSPTPLKGWQGRGGSAKGAWA
jgi:hypothetical protein